MLKFFEQLKDPYERNARITPGLLIMLPILVPLVATYGPKNPVLTGVLSLFFGCGAIFALANIARGSGKRLEERLVLSWGGLPTTILLRHQNGFFDRHTKERYHEAIRQKLDIPIPNAESEKSCPYEADQAYIAAGRRLRELTRGDKKLLLKENIAYGFHRNMAALKPIGIVSSLIGLIYGANLAGLIPPKEPYLDAVKLFSPGLAGGITILTSVTLLTSLIFYFSDATIWRIGCVYAERLFEQLPSLKMPRKRTTSTNTS